MIINETHGAVCFMCFVYMKMYRRNGIGEAAAHKQIRKEKHRNSGV